MDRTLRSESIILSHHNQHNIGFILYRGVTTEITSIHGIFTKFAAHLKKVSDFQNNYSIQMNFIA